MRIHLFLLLGTLLASAVTRAQQYPDTTYTPSIGSPMYAQGEGPLIYIDGAHQNMHQRDGGYAAFAKLLEQDGYQTAAWDKDFSSKSLRNMEVLVIVNAIHPDNQGRWWKPIYSAFTPKEVEAVQEWVRNGGRLWLTADHMPMAGAAAELAAAFDARFHDGFAYDTAQGGVTLMCRANSTLSEGSVTNGSQDQRYVDSVYSFTGQAFEIDSNFENIMPLTGQWWSLEPDTAWQFNDSTPRFAAEGWSQGAVRTFGKGRVVLWGEAAMFTAQIVETEEGTFKAGMNSERAKENYKLLLNLMEWLTAGL
ncbi:DUF4350 domain-containing protein [Cryomorphaceae bacterium]|nr:DUF4350 domain-containing protein [Cryomorphaceae bacterium]